MANRAKRKVRSAARIIEREIGWINGWHVSAEKLKELSWLAAEKIIKLVERRKRKGGK